MRILALNKGTSSLKYLLAEVAGGKVTEIDRGQASSVAEVVRAAGRDPIGAVGHRVVHGGRTFTQPTLIDDAALEKLEELGDLAPLHNPPAVAAIRETLRELPGVPEYAVFDTAFHATMPAAAATYAVPKRWREEFDVRRFGFHGLAHRWMAEWAAEQLGRPLEELRLVTLQLGSGASACAIADGRSVDTSMGMTPAEGLVMATRSGDVDPLLVQHLVRTGAGEAEELWTALERESGLAGLAGEKDMKALLARVEAGDEDARLAFDVYCLRIRKYVGAYLAELGGADAVVFGGGVGEHAPLVRQRALAGLEFLGIGSRIAVLVCRVDEESLICRDVAAALSSAGSRT